MSKNNYDVIVAGGGLAALLQQWLRQEMEQKRYSLNDMAF